MKPKHILILSAVILLVAIASLLSRLSLRKAGNDITLKETPTVIESSRPVDILYLYSTITEDYAIESFYGSGLGGTLFGKENGILKRKHECVQILKQQVSLTMDLDKVRYQAVENSDTVRVILPPVEFSQSTLSSWFKSDNEGEESAVQYDAKPLIQRVERRIESRYNTSGNRKKAKEKAQATIATFLKQCGKTAVFVE